MSLRITHGRHCICSACAREDWTNPNLAPCGMHGKDCPALYRPLGRPGEVVPSPSEGSARLVVYLDVKLQDDAAAFSADELMAAMQNLLGTALVNTPTSWAEIDGVEVGSCAISRSCR